MYDSHFAFLPPQKEMSVGFFAYTDTPLFSDAFDHAASVELVQAVVFFDLLVYPFRRTSGKASYSE